MNLLEQLEDIKRFTPTEQKVVQYMLENPQMVKELSINALADETYTSNPVIIRLCKKLGYPGFKEFRIAFAMAIESNKYVDRTVDFSKPFSKEESTGNIIHNMSALYKNTIDLVNSQLDEEMVEKAALMIHSAERVFIYGIGDSAVSAQNFIRKSLKIGKFFHLLENPDEELHACKYVTRKDCCIFLTYGSADYYLPYFEEVKKRRCPIITISSLNEHTLAKKADAFIHVPQNESHDKIATFYSQLAFTYILSIIYALLYNESN